MTTLTVEHIRQAADYLKSRAAEDPIYQFSTVPLGSVRIVVSPYALAETDERKFPVSKHRSARIHKKLVKRFGGEFRKVPTMYSTKAGTIIAHPALEARLRSWLSGKVDAMVERTLRGDL